MEQEPSFRIEISDSGATASLDGHLPSEDADAPLTREVVLRALDEAGVKYGVLHDAITALVEQAASGEPVPRTVVARGQPPAPGTDGEIQWSRQAGDFVVAGDEIARTIPGKKSVAGRSVTDEERPGRDGVDPVLEASTGVSYDETTRCALATAAGVVVISNDQISLHNPVSVAPDAMTATLDWPAPAEGGRVPAFKELLGLIQQCGITFGADDTALMECLAKLRAGEAVESLVFARGRPPQDGPDGHLTLHFSPNLKPGVERADGSMDFRSRDFGASMVDKDSVIATLLPPELGQVGSDVTGAPLTAGDGSPLVVTAGEGVRTSDDGTTFYAELDGRGTLKGGVIAVHDMVLIEGDVDFKTGHVDAQSRGVEVMGSVRSTFNVKSGGTMIIHGNVGDSRVTSVADILVVGGVIHSGRGEGEVRCHAHVTAHHTQNARIRASGDVTITHGAINSNIRVRGRVFAPADAGRIVGGSVLAASGIVAHAVGSEAHVQTRLAVSTAQETLELLEEDRADIHARRAPLQAMLGEKNMLGDGQNMPAALRDVYDALQQLERSLEEVDAAEEKLRQEMDEGKGLEATVQVVKVAHPGVTVVIGDRSFTVEVALANVEFYFDHQKNSVEYRDIDAEPAAAPTPEAVPVEAES